MNDQESDFSETIPAFLAPPVGFKARRAAQIIALFAARSTDGIIEKLKLIKLVYLTEREHLKKHRVPLLYDELFSLPHGPICSSTLNCIDGRIYNDVCDEYMLRNGNIVMARKKYDRVIYDELSDAAIEAIDAVWLEHGNKTASQLRNFTHIHENVPEYIEVPPGTRAPITYESVLSAVGRDDAKEGEEFIDNIRRLESASV